MIAEDLLFWIAPLSEAPVDEPGVLCERHADAMVVPRGWTLDDRRENVLRLFTTRARPVAPAAPRPRRRHHRPDDERPEQLQIDGTGEIARPVLDDDTPDDHESPPAERASDEAVDDAAPAAAGEASSDASPEVPSGDWRPSFDPDDDLDGLLEVSSPLLARAFRGADRRRP